MEFELTNSGIEMYPTPVLGSEISEERIVMALTVDKERAARGEWIGLARVITRREGNVDVPGYVDKSKLVVVGSKDGLVFEELGGLKIKGIDEVIRSLSFAVDKDREFIGLEDPDILTDELGRKHVYFTIAFRHNDKSGYDVYLGYASGDKLTNLVAHPPVLGPLGNGVRGFKEVCVSPKLINRKRINLIETNYFDGEEVSVISAVKSKAWGGKWENLGVVCDPREMKYSWCSGHLSPCTFFPESFLIHKKMLVGIVNGREKNRKIGGKKMYGKFRPGLILFNPRTGEIPWISEEPLLEDPKATTITFASDFVLTGKDEGILYCHVNDSFVRAYKLRAEKIGRLLP